MKDKFDKIKSDIWFFLIIGFLVGRTVWGLLRIMSSQISLFSGNTRIVPSDVSGRYNIDSKPVLSQTFVSPYLFQAK